MAPDRDAPMPRMVSTGHLPSAERVQALLDDAHGRYRHLGDGDVADHIPALADASPDLFGIAIADVDGHVFTAGESDHPFSIQSVSKPFVFALCLVLVAAFDVSGWKPVAASLFVAVIVGGGLGSMIGFRLDQHRST